jgi:serine/threonine protein phosphatase 1
MTRPFSISDLKQLWHLTRRQAVSLPRRAGGLAAKVWNWGDQALSGPWARIRTLLGGASGPSVDLGQLTATSWHGRTLPNHREAKPAARECLYAIGDIHGRADLLEALLDKIDADVANLPKGLRKRLIFLGDYIDRGPASRQVIDILVSRRLQRFRPVFLAGNHEDALFRFQADAHFGAEWLHYGGGETLASYGVLPAGTRHLKDAQWVEAWRALQDAMPARHKAFFNNLSFRHTSGDYTFVHAGLRPGVALPDQSPQDMMWIRETFLSDPKPFPHMVVHGHTPTEAPYSDDRRIGLDTGAYATGVLTAARLFGTDIRIIATSPSSQRT